jgi:hypothetical protein
VRTKRASATRVLIIHAVWKCLVGHVDAEVRGLTSYRGDVLVDDIGRPEGPSYPFEYLNSSRLELAKMIETAGKLEYM